MKQQSKKYLLLILLIAVFVIPQIALAAWWNPFSWGVWNRIFHFKQTEQKQEQLIGGDKDAHGCLIAAGYTWCEAKQKCLRTFEEACLEGDGLPTIDSITPSSGPVGTIVIIKGNNLNFDSFTYVGISESGQKALKPDSISSNQIKFTIPENLPVGAHNISVFVSAKHSFNSNNVVFTVTPTASQSAGEYAKKISATTYEANIKFTVPVKASDLNSNNIKFCVQNASAAAVADPNNKCEIDSSWNFISSYNNTTQILNIKATNVNENDRNRDYGPFNIGCAACTENLMLTGIHDMNGNLLSALKVYVHKDYNK